MVHVRTRFATASAALALTALAAFGAPTIGAQDATPMAGMAGAMAPIPNHIHAGTCDNLTPEPLIPLADAQFPAAGAMAVATPMAGMDMATPMAGMMGMGATAAAPVAVATTQVDLPLSDILAAEHSINAHDPAAPADPTRYLACGEIGGTPDAQGNLFVGLRELNDSGYSGVAWLLDDGTGTGTTVTVFLSNNEGAVSDLMGGTEAIATPTS
jgi:hypothetical protein